MIYDIVESIKRMTKAVGVKTQADLGGVLGISQASISDAKRKGKIPPEWLVKLAEERDINPNWIKTGQGPMKIGEPGNNDLIPAAATGQHQPAYGDGPVENQIDLLNAAKAILEGGTDRAQTLMAVINTLSRAAVDEGKVLRFEAQARAGIKPALREVEPPAKSLVGQRLIDWLRSMEGDDLAMVIADLENTRMFRRYLDQIRDEQDMA